MLLDPVYGMAESSPVLSSPYRGDSEVYGPSSVPDSFYRRYVRMAWTQACKTTYIYHKYFFYESMIQQKQLQWMHAAYWPTCVMIPHAKSTFKIIGIQQIFGDFFAGFLFGKLLYGAFSNTWNVKRDS